ncbi:MAG TPA: RHS repeat-associated core domain-containing protein, partial [Verrucomicrobiae bacterium]|nr:RHS repeat-associated core domain-containing protein [Verrucomicrobiae bacterium]
TASYLHTDALGSPVLRTNSSRVGTADTAYDPWGDTWTGNEPSTFGYTGHVNDTATGLVQMQERYYDPLLGRFVSRDPVLTSMVDGSNFNKFWYANNNPYRYTDPDGRFSVAEVGLITTAVVIVAYGACPSCRQSITNGVQAVHDAISNATADSRPSTLSPGPNAGDSIPARGPGRDFTPEERGKINGIGNDTGCHTCGATDPGTKTGNWIPDHQPPNGVNEDGGPQRLYPHCKGCSSTQGGDVNGSKTRGKTKEIPEPPKPKQEEKS